MCVLRDVEESVNAVPEPLRRVADVFATFEPDWYLCGGWAADAWLGRTTREHRDVDVVVFAEDRRAIFEQLAGWSLVAHERDDDEHEDAWDGRPVALGTHVHARPEDGFELELFLDERSEGMWVLRRVPRITRPLSEAVAWSPWGLPTAAPEVVCFLKATAYHDGPTSPPAREVDEADFLALEPTLTTERRDWLRSAIAAVDPSHRWLRA